MSVLAPERDALAAKRICSDCVREAYLSNLIERDGKVGSCNYCGNDETSTWSTGDLANKVEIAFADHFVRTPDQPPDEDWPMYSHPEFGRTWYREGDRTVHAIEEAAQIPARAAADIQKLLAQRHDDIEAGRMGKETEFAADANYDWKGTDASRWHQEWFAFENTLKTEARFFNRESSTLLARVFNNIDTLRASRRRQPVVGAGPGRRLNHLFRARVFQSDEKLMEALSWPALHLGSPPPRLAAAGRMNARGISVFYGATNASAALAEVRPPVGSKVALARFNIIRPLRLLDLTALDSLSDTGSFFDPTLRTRLERIAFLKSLGDRMTRPVMPDDEALDYLTTQAIADFLSTENQPLLDGIVFRSVQSRTGRNVVLFHQAARVSDQELPPGTRVDAHNQTATDEGWETDYVVTEFMPGADEAPKANDDPFALMHPYINPWPPVDTDLRPPTLAVDAATVEVRHINSVLVQSTTFGVRRSRYENRRRKF